MVVTDNYLDQGAGQLPVWDRELDFARLIVDDGRYRQKLIPFPGREGLTIAGYESRTGTLVVEPKSYLMAINAFTELASGVFVSLFDKGSQSYLIDGGYLVANQLGGGMELGQTEPARQGWFNGPYLITGSGELQVTITNNGATAGIAQVLFFFAERRE